MDTIKKIKALGLMSSSSLSGISAAVITTDGVDVYDIGRSVYVPYDDEIRERLQFITGKKPNTEELEKEFKSLCEDITKAHAEVVDDIINYIDMPVDVIGFHGHTILHKPQEHYTYQLGNGQLLADITKTKVVNRFSNADLLAGGQGGPLVPVYHAALVNDFEKPVAVVNISGISSITWVGNNGELLAFDIGPGNAAINDWVFRHAGQQMDYNGKLAITGKIHGKVLANLMRHKFLAQYPPKSLDRNQFNDKLEHLEGLNLEDGAATVTAFVAEAIAYSMAMYLPQMPKKIIICGGGAKNPTLVRFLRQRLEKVEVIVSGELGWRPDTMEAQAYAFLATRRLYCLPNSFPSTTGVPEPVVGGELYAPKEIINQSMFFD